MARPKQVTVTVPVPRLPGGDAAGDALGVLGLVAIVVCVGGMVGNWWISGVLAGIAAVFLSWVAAKNAAGSAATVDSTLASAPAAAPLYGRGRPA